MGSVPVCRSSIVILPEFTELFLILRHVHQNGLVMRSKDERIFSDLRKLARAFDNEKGFSDTDINKAKAIATDLYLKHSSREVTLSAEEFKMVVNILQFSLSD